ncbi:F-box/LRR-repeat protein At3g26922-like [Nymphaea colorata]|nr:F-box/LRR-repeat protein At3g26922-like [Nymphaea colorata]
MMELCPQNSATATANAGGGLEDHLSDLPQHLLLSILSLLPTREAVATSSLSRRWRNAWSSLPSLDLGTELVKAGASSAPKAWAEVVLRLLSFRDAPVLRCRISNALEKCRHDVDRAIGILVDRGVRDLGVGSLRVGAYRLPSSLFRCDSIRVLELRGCLLGLPPQGFDGFPRLETLRLVEATFDGGTFDRLVRGSSVLENLVVDGCFGFKKLVVSSPTLRSFDVACNTWEILEIEHAPRLSQSSVSLSFLNPKHTSDLRPLLQGLVRVGRLSLQDDFVWVCFQEGVSWKHFPATFSNLKKLAIDANLRKGDDVGVVSWFLENSPNLAELSIMDHPLVSAKRTLDVNHWRTKAPFHCLIHHLAKVEIHFAAEHECIMEFMTFLIENGRALRQITAISLVRQEKTFKLKQSLLDMQKRFPWVRLLFKNFRKV